MTSSQSKTTISISGGEYLSINRPPLCYSDKGVKASDDIYSIVETAKSNGLNVFKYFELLLNVLPSMTFLTNPNILEEILTWNESVQKIC